MMSTHGDAERRTFAGEEFLPRLPLPTLEESCGRFLEWCAPLLTADELAATEAGVASFLRPGGPARSLQHELERYDATEGVHSWLDEFWDDRYLGRRDPIAVNANYFCLLQDTGEGQIERAAALIAAALDRKLLLDAERVPPVTRRGRALSMAQYRHLFSTTRIPRPGRDTVRTPYSERSPGPSRERHIVVAVRGRMFRMDVIGPTGHPHTLAELAAGLRTVLAAGRAAPASDASVGHLTTRTRPQWAGSRRALLRGNGRAIDTIETALFCLCLEDAAPRTALEACDHLLHGDGGNRWFDKSLSFIVFADGTAGLNVEHARLDGTLIAEFADALLARSGPEHSRRSGARPQGTPATEPIEFVLDAGLRRDVRAAAASFATLASGTAARLLAIEGFGAEEAKRLRVSPDAFMQMAYQLAHWRTRGFLGATYESISTRHHRHGRTEAMRVVTPEAVRFVAAMSDPAADGAARGEAFRAAADAHVRRARECQAGRAPEQHLWELQLIRRRRGEGPGGTGALPLHETPGWLTMRRDHLSTSSVSSDAVRCFGFGPTGDRCIGIAYTVRPHGVNLYLTAPRRIGDELAEFADRLQAAIGELRALTAAGRAD